MNNIDEDRWTKRTGRPRVKWQRTIVENAGHRLVVAADEEHARHTPIVLLHGFGSSIDNWPCELVAGLQKGWPVMAVSLPLHWPATADEGWRGGELTAAAIETLVADAIFSITDRQPILLGHSTGGWLALRLAARFPARVRAVASISGFASGRLESALGRLQSMAFGDGSEIRRAKAMIRYVASRELGLRLLAHQLGVPGAGQASDEFDDAFIKALLVTLRRHDSGALLEWLRLIREGVPAEVLRRVNVPVLVVHGGKDRIVNPAEGTMITETVGGPASFHCLASCGHVPHFTHVDELLSVCAAWLQETVLRP